VGKRHFFLLGPFSSNALENPLLETSQSAKKLKYIAWDDTSSQITKK
jgi:hypothetical protein